MNSAPSLPRRGKVFDGVLYAMAWEDPELDRAAFRLTPKDTVFTITSGGCNALAFLLDDPAHIISLDLNPHQNHLLELKMAAYRALSYDELLSFLGVRPASDRLESYRALRPQLSPDARAFWDGRRADIGRGIIHSGRYERYMRLLGRSTRALVGTAAVERMFTTDDPDERAAIYERAWATMRWRALTRLLLSRRVMSMLFDPAFFAQLGASFSFGAHFERVIRRALTVLTPSKSPFLAYALLGEFPGPESMPVCLRREHVGTIRDRLDRISLVSDDCLSYLRTLPPRSVTRFNFTNIFEWMPVPAYVELLRESVRVASDGAVMTYRNLLVPRRHPRELEPTIVGRDDEAASLHELDRSFIYRAYVVEQVQHGASSWTA